MSETPFDGGGPAGGALYDLAQFEYIDVDIVSLGDFADALQAEVDTNLVPALERLTAQVQVGPRFGLSPQLDQVADKAFNTYGDYLLAANTLFANLVEGTRQLAAAARQIGAGYGGADQFSQIRAEDVAAVLPPVPPSPPQTVVEFGPSDPFKAFDPFKIFG